MCYASSALTPPTAATPHPALRATCLACGLGQVAALTAHRAVIHYRNLRFATLEGKAYYAPACGEPFPRREARKKRTFTDI